MEWLDDHEVPISRICGLVWNCTDWMPKELWLRLATLEELSARPPLGLTYACGARRLRQLIRAKENPRTRSESAVEGRKARRRTGDWTCCASCIDDCATRARRRLRRNRLPPWKEAQRPFGAAAGLSVEPRTRPTLGATPPALTGGAAHDQDTKQAALIYRFAAKSMAKSLPSLGRNVRIPV